MIRIFILTILAFSSFTSDLQKSDEISQDSILITDLKDLYSAFEINRHLTNNNELIRLSYMNGNKDDIYQTFSQSIEFNTNITTIDITNDTLRNYLDNYILNIINYEQEYRDTISDSISIKQAEESFVKNKETYYTYLNTRYSTSKFIHLSEDEYWNNIEKKNHITKKEYIYYDSIKFENILYAVKYLDSVSVSLKSFQEYSIYQIEIANQHILQDEEFGYNNEGSFIGEEIAIEKYLNILDKKEYSLYLFDAWRRWRCISQRQNGFSKFSSIDNDFYNEKRKEVTFFILDYIIENPTDEMAINQFLLFATHENILRFGEYDYGNQNTVEYYKLFAEKFDF